MVIFSTPNVNKRSQGYLINEIFVFFQFYIKLNVIYCPLINH